MLRRVGQAAVVVALGLALAFNAQAEELIVSAAASLTNVFREVGTSFERSRPGSKAVFNFSASGALLQQIENGAPVDVLASADRQTMDAAEARNLIVRPSRRDFAANTPVLIRPSAGTVPLRALTDLVQPAVRRIALCDPASVPAGRYAREALQAGRLWERVESRFVIADSVRQALDYVARGEVHAGFVFATDAALARDKVTVVAELNTKTPVVYPIAVVQGSKHGKLADAFIGYVLGPEGQSILAGYGFGRP